MALRDVIDQMLEAVAAERAAVRRALGALEGRTSASVREGVRRVFEPGAHLYRFECELDFLLGDGTRVQVHAPGDSGTGEVVDHDPALGLIELVLRDDLGERVPEATLSFDSTHLLDRLAGRLEALRASCGADGAPGAPGLARALRFLEGSAAPRPPVPVSAPGLSARQQAAVSFALGQEAAYLWGPPGTGKTQTVARLVLALIERGERVLLAAHTNVATDTALVRVLEQGALPPLAAVRVGSCGAALRRFDVGLDEQVDRALKARWADEVAGLEALCALAAAKVPGAPRHLTSARVALPRRFRAAAELLPRLPPGEDPEAVARASRLEGALRRVEQEVVEGASLVASTLTRVATGRLLRAHSADAVIIDEASIASLVLAFVAACGARRRTLAAGDFMQLPAIAQAEEPAARRWLGRHVFTSAGCDRADREHPLRAMLDEQWRMHPQISRSVSALFYAGKLRDAPQVRARAHPGPAMLIVDTSRLPALSETVASGSKRNPLHARLAAAMVARARESGVAVIAPYRAQVRRLRDEIRALAPARLARGEVEVFTVHRFQGRDKDLVLFDLVEAPGTRCRFLSELENVDAPNLINVAMSRARERLVVLAHLDHLAAALGQSALVNRAFARLRAEGALEVVAGDARDEALLDGFLRGEALGAAAH